MSTPLIRVRNAGYSGSTPFTPSAMGRWWRHSAILLVMIQAQAFAASHYINAAATGTNDGSSWANAFPSFAAAITSGMIRGDTYYVAGGTYNESPYINVPLSGSLWVYIKKANLTDNGSDPGWDPSFATTVATVTMFDLDKGYVSIDGVTGSGTAGHGFHILNPGTGTNTDSVLLENGKGPFSLNHCNIEGSGFAATANPTTGIYYNNSTPVKNLYVGNCWIHQVTTNGVIFIDLVGTSYNDPGFTFENNVISESGGCLDPTNHGQGMQLGYTSELGFCIIRNNTYRNIVGSGMIVFLGSTGANHHDIQIYNNSFYITDLITYNVISPGVIWAEAQRNGATGVFITNLSVINNTFYNLGSATASSVNGSVILEAPASGNILVNNLWENCRLIGANEGFAVESNSGYYNNNLNVPTGIPKEVNGSATTFVNGPAYNFNLVSGGYAIGRGTNFPSIFTTDANGTPRGGVWDLGAFQFQTTANAAPSNAQVAITITP